jgi:hypothetical protein
MRPQQGGVFLKPCGAIKQNGLLSPTNRVISYDFMGFYGIWMGFNQPTWWFQCLYKVPHRPIATRFRRGLKQPAISGWGQGWLNPHEIWT